MAAKKSKKRITKEEPKQYFDSEKKFLVYEVFPESKKTIYYIKPESGQYKFTDKVILDGFVGLPTGLYLNRQGFGFGKKGTFLFQRIKDHISHDKKLELIVTKDKVKNLTQSRTTTKITLPYLDVRRLISKFSGLNEEFNNELRETADSFLSTKFPKKVSVSTADFDEYKAGEVYSLLKQKNLAKKLNDEDLSALGDLYPQIFKSDFRRKKVKAQRDQLIQKSKITTDKIYLDLVIKEYEENLSKKSLKEEVWQKFLKEKVLKYLINYVEQIDKENISLDVSFPDFVVVDVYGFVDIFEIKTHNTPLLAFDDNHDNYYWRSEISQAISQIESYVDELVYNSDAYIKKIKRKKELDIKVIRPKGLIIAGSSKQFKKKKELEDFRKLSKALKNTEFILYDQLLENLKILRARLK